MYDELHNKDECFIYDESRFITEMTVILSLVSSEDMIRRHMASIRTFRGGSLKISVFRVAQNLWSYYYQI